MSAVFGIVYHDDHIAGHFQFDLTLNRARTRIFDTSDEVAKAWWRPELLEATCVCGEKAQPVELEADNGLGIRWESTACFACRAIRGKLDMLPLDFDAWEEAALRDISQGSWFD